MSLAIIIGSVVGVAILGVIIYGIMLYFDLRRDKKETAQELQDLRKWIQDREEEEDASESDSESEEDFQDLRHHRLIHESQPAYRPGPPPIVSGGPVSTSQDPAMLAYAKATAQAANLSRFDDEEGEAQVIKYEKPIPPSVEEWNDIRIFYTSSLPVTLDNLNIENCVECELLDAVVPRGDYVIHSRNQTFQVREPLVSQTYTDITIPQGDYAASTLATTITSLVTTAGFTNFTAATSTLTKNFTFRDDSVLDIIFTDELAYDLGWGTSTTLNLGSVQFPVSSSATYEVTITNQSFEVSINSGAYATFTIAIGTYTAATLAAAINTALSGPPLAAAYFGGAAPVIAFYHTTGAALDVRLSHGLMALLGLTTSTGSSVYDSSVSRYYATGLRADLYGSRYVEIRTEELNAPHLHQRGVLQAAFLANEITNWRSNGADALRRRRFISPVSLRKLTISFKERHPSKSSETDFYDMELNGLAISLCICFRRLRYKNEARSTELGMH